MLPKDLTRDIINRLNTLKGQIEGISNMLKNENDPEHILIQFKAIQKAVDKAHYLLLDEVYRKALAIKIVKVIDTCPGNCGNEDKIEYIRQQFPLLHLDQLTAKMKEISDIEKRLEQYNEDKK